MNFEFFAKQIIYLKSLGDPLQNDMSKNRFREISLSVHKIPKFKYFAKVIIHSESADHVL